MSFIELNNNELNSLVEPLKSRFPKSAQISNVLRIHLDKLFIRNGIPETKFFKYDGLELSKTCIVSKSIYRIAISEELRACWVILFAHSNSENNIEFHRPIITALKEIVNMDEYNCFNAIQKNMAPLILDVFKNMEFRCADPGLTFYLNPTKNHSWESLKIRTDENEHISSRQLAPEDIQQVVDCWKHSAEGTNVEECTLLATQIASCCICVNEKPVSWAVQFSDGAIHAAFTLEEYRGRGLAKKMIADLWERIIQKNQVPVSHIERGNDASIALHSGVGFELVHEICWVELRPQKKIT